MITELLSLLISYLSFTNTPSKTITPPTISTLFTVSAPIKEEAAIRPLISSKASLVIDLNSKHPLHSQNPELKLPIASLTKLMTAYIILKEHKLDEIVTIKFNNQYVIGSKVGLQRKEQMSIKNLLEALLIKSGNDAAVALAIHNAKTVNSFVDKMNKESRKLGLLNTKFQNPIGLDHPNNYSTANDLAKLSLLLYENNNIREIINKKEIEISSTSNQYKIKNTNKLLNSYLNIKGFKTGKTDNAKECLITVAENKDKKTILTIVIGSEDRFYDTKTLIEWTFQNFIWYQ